MSINYIPTEEDLKESAPFEKKVIPEGTEVNLRFTDAEFKSNSAGWKGLKLKGVITDGEFANYFIDEMITLENPTHPDAVKYGRQTQGKLCRALGLGGITHESQLLGLPVIAVIKDVSAKKPDFPNTIKGYKMHPQNPAMGGGQTPAPQQQPAPQAPPQQQAPQQQYQAPAPQQQQAPANPFGTQQQPAPQQQQAPQQQAPSDHIPF